MMTMVLLLQEGVAKDGGKVKEKERPTQMEQVQEDSAPIEQVTKQWEASMALVCLQGSALEEVPDVIVKRDEVLKEIPYMNITSLHLIIMDGKEFLFLDDIAKKFGLCKDKALSIISINAGAPSGNIKINFEDDHISKMLAYTVGGKSLEEVVAKALSEIKQDMQFYQSIRDANFEPHMPWSTNPSSWHKKH